MKHLSFSFCRYCLSFWKILITKFSKTLSYFLWELRGIQTTTFLRVFLLRWKKEIIFVISKNLQICKTFLSWKTQLGYGAQQIAIQQVLCVWQRFTVQQHDSSGEIVGSLSDFDFQISILSLSTLIGLPLDIISKCMNILSKPTEPKVSSATSVWTDLKI